MNEVHFFFLEGNRRSIASDTSIHMKTNQYKRDLFVIFLNFLVLFDILKGVSVRVHILKLEHISLEIRVIRFPFAR